MPKKYKYEVKFLNELLKSLHLMKAVDELDAWGRKGKYEMTENSTILLKGNDEVDVITETFRESAYEIKELSKVTAGGE